jgi:hypothetical protein
MNKAIATTIALLAGLTISTGALAVVPDVIPVQGVLADADEAPVDGLVDMTFTLYTAETLGTALWTDTFTDVDVDMGFFTVYLGSGAALDFYTLLANDEIWLGVAIETDAEMDRFRFYSVPFAQESLVCERVGNLTEADINTSFMSSSSPAAGITDANITNWNTAYGWGDHTGLYAPVSHNHDDMYYTETELGTSGSAAVHWGNLTGVPAGFADGVDDDTTYNGNDFALSGQWCGAGDVVTGIESDGLLACEPPAGTDTRRWAALGRHAVGRGIYRMLDYAVVMQTATSLAAWRVDIPHGATITRFAVTMAKCNDQTGNTATCRLRRHSASSFGSISTLSTFVAPGVLDPCSQTFEDTGVLNPIVSDSYVYAIECFQTADKSTSIYGVQVEYTP